MAYNLSENLTIQLQLLEPTAANIGAIRRQLEAGLKGINIGSLDTKNFVKANAEVNNLSKTLDKGREKAGSFFDALEGKARGFAAYTVASTAILKLTGAISQATREAIKYESELLKISQVTGDSVNRTKDLSKSLFDISKQYNVNISKIAQLTRTLTQTGLSFREAAKGAEVLARTSLLATFDSLTNTTEGLIATMQTFNLTVTQSGKVLEKINTVSKAFAVESSDIVEAIRRTGGAFSAAGGQVEELIALFTSVRSTTRESAETIATGFRTIFGRLQRPKTIEYFKQLGIQLETAEGQFIGPLKAIEEISKGLDRLNISAGSTKFAEVVEQIGGIRQISRVIPLLEQYKKTQSALDIQNKSSAESYKDIEKAQKGLGFQLGQLKQEFSELIAEFVNSGSFKVLAQTFIGIARTVISITKALKPLLPIITAIATVKLGRGISKLLSGGFSLKGAKESLGFARGGVVPGSGNGDTVPAMLTPGEFVIRKSAVKAYGASNLAKINKYAKGGPVTLGDLNKRQGKSTISESLNDKRQLKDSVIANLNRQQIKFGDDNIDWNGLVKRTDEIYQPLKASGKGSRSKNKKNAFYAAAKAFEEAIQKITGGKLSEDPDAPVDIVKGGENIEVKFTRQMTNVNDLISKLYRQKFLTNSLPNTFTTGKDKGVDIGDLTVMEMGEGEKAKFQEWYGKNKAGILKKAMGGIIRKSSGSLQAMFEKGSSSQGQVDASSIGSGLYAVTNSQVTGGGGRALYDAVMEMATEKGARLVSDRSKVSRAALTKIWGNYFSKGVGADGKSVKKTPVSPESMYLGSFFNADDYPEENPSTWKGEALPLQYAYQKFAKGGGVGTDTVPALLTPGEFVVNKKSAQAFGYNNLRKINKYASGGTVDGVEVQRFGDGDVVLSKEEKKRRREQYKSDQLGTSLTRGERTGGVLKGIAAKYEKLYKEERAIIKEIYQVKANNAIKEGKSVQAVLDEYQEAVADTKKAFQAAGNKALTDKKSEIKLKKANESLVIIQDKTAEKLKKSSAKFNVSMTELIFYAEAAANSLEQFAGISINREALEAGKVKAAKYDIAGAAFRKINTENVEAFSRRVKIAGQTVGKFGDKIGGTFGKVLVKTGAGLEKFGGALFAKAGTLAKIGKIGNVVTLALGGVELLGGFIDALFSKNYTKVKERAIASGDVEGAGDAALKAYNQQFLRGIPIVGSLLSAVQEYVPFLNFEADARGRLIQKTAEAQASMVKFDKEISRITTDLQSALLASDFDKVKSSVEQQATLINDLTSRADDLMNRGQGDTTGNIFGRVASGAGQGAMIGGGIGSAIGFGVGALGFGVGALPGAGIGGAIGTAVGTVAGAIYGYIDAVTAGSADAVAAFQTAGELYEKAGIEQVKRLEFFSGELNSLISSVILGGGSLEQAFDLFKEKFGQAAFDEMFGGVDVNSLDGLKQAAQEADARVQASRKSIDDMSASLSQINAELDNSTGIRGFINWLTGTSSELKKNAAQTEAELKKAKADEEVAQSAKIAALQAAQLARETEILAEVRKRENAALRESLILMQNRIKLFDRINRGSRSMQLALEDVNAAMSGGISSRQILSSRNIGVSAETLNMSGEEVMRDDTAFNEMFDAVARLGDIRLAAGLQRTRNDLDILNKLQTDMIDNLDSRSGLGKVIAEARGRSQAGDAGGAEIITNEIIKQLGLTDASMSPALRAALDKYGKALLEGADAGTALEELKKDMTEDQIKLIEETQAKYNEYIEMEKQLQSMRIEEIKRLGDLNKKAYDSEKDYFEQRMAVTEKVDDFLNPEPLGAGRAGFLQQRANQRRQSRMDALGSARQRGGLPADTRGREASFRTSVEGIDVAANDAATSLAQLAVDGEALLSTLQDEISYEKEYLDGLIEMAKAQQEYTQALNDAQGELVRDLVTGTEEEQADLLSTLNAAALSAMQGSFQGIPEDMKKGIFSIFDQFGDVEIPGLGMTGRDAQRNITKNELMMNWGLDEATADQLASKAVKDRVPIDERMKEMIELQEAKILELLERERMMKEYLQRIDQFNNQLFSMSVDKFAEAVDHFVNNVLNAPRDDASGQAAVDAAQELTNLQDRQNAEMAKVDGELNAAKSDRDRAAKHLEQREKKTAEAEADLEQQRKNLQTARDLDAADGGNRTDGQLERFQRSQGRLNAARENERAARERLNSQEQRVSEIEDRRDTLRSRQEDERDMLIETRQAEIDAENVNVNTGQGGAAPQSIARGGVVYASGGMLVNYEPKGTDTVPAMLTPGEFVMRKEAVNRIGADNLEKMNRGGIVNYLADGGSSNGAYRSQANINRFGASDPRFEQYGLRGLDPNSPYYEQALAYWQQIMDFQNKYNARAANMNEMVGNSQMQWMAMMQNMWAQSGYFANGGKVQGPLSKYGINTTPMLGLNGEENLQMGASLAPLAGGAGAVLGGAAVAAGTGVVGITAAPAAALGIAASLPIAGIAAGIYALDEKGRKYQQEKAARWRKERVETDNKIRGEHYAKKYGLGDGSPLTAEEAVKLSNDMAERNRELDRQQKQRIADSYRQKYPDITDEQIDLFENTKIRRQMYATGKPGEVTDDPSKANMLVPTRVTNADREKGLTTETVLKSAGPLPESNIEYRNGIAFKKDPTAEGFRDTSFKGFPEKAFVDTTPGPFEQKLIDKQKAIADAQAAADANAKIVGSSKIPGTVSGVGGMTLDDGTSGSFTNMALSSEPYDPFADVTSAPSPVAVQSAAPIEAAAAAAPIEAAAAAAPIEAAAAAAAAAAVEPSIEPTGPSFTPTGNVGVDALMNKPLDIKEGKERGNQARYRSRLDALRRAGADNNALDEFKSQYRGQVYGAENQQLYDYNKSRLGGRAAYMIHPSERTPEQQARAQAYKADILAPNAAAHAKSQKEGTPMPSMQERAAEYQKRKAGTGAAATSALETAATSASASGVASQSRPSLGSSIGGALGGLFGGSAGSTAGSLAGGLIEGVAGGNINLQEMLDNVKNNLSQSSASPLQQNTNAAPNIPAQVAAQSRTSNLLGGGQNNDSSGTGTGYGGGGGMGGGGPIQVNTTGTQEIIVRLPDIQALVNQSITSLIYQTVGETFNNIASKVATNQNFEDLQRTFSEGVTETQTKQVNSSSTIGGK